MAEFAQGGLITRSNTTVTSGGTLTLTVADVTWQILTGTLSHTVVLPDALTLKNGRMFQLHSQSSGIITITFNSGAIAGYISGPGVRDIDLLSNSTSNGTWAITSPLESQSPLKLSQSFSVNSKLTIQSNRAFQGDGTTASTSIIDNAFSTYPVTTIDFQTGVTTGGTVNLNNAAFSLPASTSGQYKRAVLVYDSANNRVNVTFSLDSPTVNGLTAPDVLVGGSPGLVLGYLDLQGTATGSPGAYKSANATTNVIVNSVSGTSTIVRFVASGSGSGSPADWNIQTVIDPNVTVHGGLVLLGGSGKEVATWDGSGSDTTSFEVPINLNLTTILGTALPGVQTTYYLYLNMDTLLTPTTIATGRESGRVVYAVSSTDATKFNLFTLTPEQLGQPFRYMPVGFIRTNNTGTAWSGTGSSFGTSALKRFDNLPTAVNPVVDRITGVSVQSVGSLGQIAAGHKITSKSFAAAVPTANIAWCNLQTDSLDGSGGGHFLTQNNAPTFTGTGLSGVVGDTSLTLNGTNQSVFSTSAFYNPGASTPIMASVNASLNNWASGSDQGIMAVGYAVNDRVWDITVRANGNIEFATSTSGTTYENIITVPNPGFGANSWHRLGVLFDFTASKFYAHIDGRLVGSVTQAALRSAGSPDIGIGVSFRGGFTAGKFREFAYVKTSTSTTTDARKLFAFRRDHNKSVLPSNQEWYANFYANTATQDYQQWLVDKSDANSVFWDLSPLGATNTADIIMRDTGMSPVIVPSAAPLDQVYSANPTFPIAHGQSDVPTLLARQEIAPNQFGPINLAGALSADSTFIYGSLAGFAPSPSARIRLNAYTGSSPVAARQADTNTLGLVKLQFGGYNKIVGPGFFASLAASTPVAGDSILILGGYTISSEEVVSASDVTITFMPNQPIIITGGNRALRLTGSRINVVRPNYLVNFAGTLAAVIQLESNDCNVNLGYLELNNAGLTVTAGFAIIGGANRGFVNGSIKTTSGTLSASITDAGTDSDFSVRG